MTTFSVATVPRENMGDATGLTSLLRNLGGSVGIALVTTVVSRGAQAHQSLMVGHMSQFNPVFNQKLATIQGSLAGQAGAPAAHDQAYGLLYQTLQQQASYWSYIDNFRMLMIVCLLCVPLVFLFKKAQRRSGEMAAAH
jgi:MFS transporter, DHA2 family, multidrug resistance protein